MYNLTKYKEILDYCNKDLILLNSEIKSLLLKNKTELEENLCDFLFAKSKRLRPVTIFLIKDCLNIKTNSEIIKLAAALELLHAATLIHDDIVDDADKRRNLQTFNKKFNSKIATIAGDYLLSLSLNLLCELNSAQIFRFFSENTCKICKGEIEQFFNKNKITTIDNYLEKSKNKTSSLFLAGVQSLIFLINEKENLPPNIQKAFLNFTLNFSLGFQIYDDIDNFQNTNSEKNSSDIENGNYTLPYLYLSQQNRSCDIIEYEKLKGLELYNEMLQFSNNYLNNVLDEAIKSLRPLEGIYKTDLLIKLAETFKNTEK